MNCNVAYPVIEAPQRNGANRSDVRNQTRTHLENIEIKYTMRLNAQALK